MAILLHRRVQGMGLGKICLRTHVSNVCALILHILAASFRVSTAGQLSFAGVISGMSPERIFYPDVIIQRS